jgi:acyl carrier protein
MSADSRPLDDLEQRVIDIITKHQKLQPGQVTLESTFSDLSIDSLDGMELVFEFEDAFARDIPDDVARNMKSVRDVVDSLRHTLTSPGQA